MTGQVSLLNPMGEPWDIIGLPDPVVDFELTDNSTGTIYRESSSIVQDDDTPTWNESIVANVPARAFELWYADVWDSDFDFDDAVCSIAVDLRNDPATYNDLFTGAVTQFSCRDNQVFASVRVRLQPN